MPYSPRGAIIRSGRLTTVDDGAELRLSAPAILVTTFADAESRRTLRRAVKRSGCVLEEVEGDAYAEQDGTFNKRTGERQRPENVQPNTFRVAGQSSALAGL